MLRYLALFALALFALPCIAENIEDELSKDIRILNLLPYMVTPPLVDPALPDYFTLGVREKDPYFSEGYIWGHKNNIEEYFEDEGVLSDCIMRAQVSQNIFQIGIDRFNFDDNPNTIMATGLIEYSINKGKWGIFPYRELRAKGSKGRKVYQLWVGLNAEGGATLDFQFIYPAFLNEPTQNQKKVWSDFVKKTTLLNLEDLTLAKGVKAKQASSNMEGDRSKQEIHISAYKRKIDQKLLVIFEPFGALEETIEVLSIEECSTFLSEILLLKAPSIIVTAAQCEECNQVESFQIAYQIVDEFPFRLEFLKKGHLQELGDHYLLFQ